MFVFGLFAVVLVISSAARAEGKEGEIVREAAQTSATLSKSGRHLRIPPPRSIPGKDYLLSNDEISHGRSYNENSQQQLPHQTIYYRGPVESSKSKIQRFRQFAIKNGHQVKKAGTGDYGQSGQFFSQQSQGYQNQFGNTLEKELVGQEHGYDSNDSDMETSNPKQQFLNSQSSAEYLQRPVGGQNQSKYQYVGTQSQTGYPSHMFESSQSQTGYPLQAGSMSQTRYPQQGTSQNQGGYPQGPTIEQTQTGSSLSQSGSLSQGNNPQNPGGNQYQTGYPQQGESNGQTGYPQRPQAGSQIKGGYGQTGSSLYQENNKSRPGSTQQQSGIQSQGINQQKPMIGQGSIPHQEGSNGNQDNRNPRPGSGQYGSSQQSVGNQYQSGYPQKPGTGQGSTAYPQQQGGNQNQGSYNLRPGGGLYGSSQQQNGSPERPGTGQTVLTQQQGANQIKGKYPQKKPESGGAQIGYPHQGGSNGQWGNVRPTQQQGSQNKGSYQKKPGNGQYGSNPRQPGSSQMQGGYPQRPTGGHTQTGFFQQQGGYIERPSSGGSQQGSEQHSGNQIQGGYPQTPSSGQYGFTNQQNGYQINGPAYPQRPVGGQMQSSFLESQGGYPGSGQGQYGSQQGGGHIQGVYVTQRPGSGQYQSNGMTGGDGGNQLGSQGNGSGGSSSSTDGGGLTTNNRLRQYCKAPRGQFASESCNKFVNCWDDVVVEQECGGVLVFNEEKSYCDYPENVDCGGRVTSNPSMGMEGDGSCPSSFATYRSNYDCGEFIVCAHGIAHRFHCAGGLAYNDTLGVCDYARNVNCMGIPLLQYPEEETTSEVEEPDENGGTTGGASYVTSESTDSELWNYRQSKNIKKIESEEGREE